MEFTIKSRKDQFRVTKISPVDMMALTSQIDFDQFNKTRELITFCLEHCEVKVGETWMPVKTPNKEIYMPMGIDEDLQALNEIFSYMMDEVIAKAFTKSSK